MIEKIITSKTRVKLLKLYLTNIDDRYYLRELERKLDESLSPLRRQLLKLVKMGILITEEEANLKYYRLNKNFVGMEELRKLVLGPAEVIASEAKQSLETVDSRFRGNDKVDSGNDKVDSGNDKVEISPLTPTLSPEGRRGKRFKYDAMVLTTIAFFVLATAVYVGYVSSRNVKQVATIITEAGRGHLSVPYSDKKATATRPDEMISKRWKILPGNIPVLSSGETGGKKSQEL